MKLHKQGSEVADLRAGVVGLGVMGRNHARVLSTLEGVTLVGIVEPASTAESLDLAVTHFDSLENLLTQGVDYCLVAVPTGLHEQVGLQLAAAGVHALVEKPLASDPESAKRLTDTFEKAKLIGAVGHIERYNPALQQARSRIQSGELGQVYQVVTRRQGPFPARIADVGVVKDLATHDIDLTSWITQQSYRAVSARTAHRTGREHEDLVTVVGTLADGTIASHTVNWLSPFKERRTIITGERGAFVADTLTADLTFYANGSVQSDWSDIALFRGVSEGDVIRFAIEKPEPLRTEHEKFRDAVLGKPADIVTMRQGLATVQVAEAILKSARTGQTVELVEE
jgi:UDP-N-acetylglucosamine 3-dehydrogenase